MMTKRQVYGYARLSKDEARSASLDVQRSKINAYASVTDREPVAEIICDDGYTGANTNRPGFQRLLAAIERGEVAAVIVAKLDRLSRSLEDVLRVIKLCEKHKTALLSVSETLDTSNAVGRLLVHVLASFGEFERERITERVTDALTHKRRSGKVYGPVPFGYRRYADCLEAAPEEQAALAQMRAMRERGASYQAIADHLNAHGPATHSGKPWSCHAVRAVLLSRMTQETASLCA